MTVNYIKQKMNDGHAVLGPFLKMNDPALIEQAALAGFDFCIIDMEHGPISFESAQNLIRAAELHGMSPIIRTTDTSDENILRALDLGAHGVEVPQVNSKVHLNIFRKGQEGCAVIHVLPNILMWKKVNISSCLMNVPWYWYILKDWKESIIWMKSLM